MKNCKQTFENEEEKSKTVPTARRSCGQLE